MGLTITLADATGKAISTLTDEKNWLHKILVGLDHRTHLMLNAIDWYGDIR